jgi:hypothetical protein
MANTIGGTITILTPGGMLAGGGTTGLDGMPDLSMVAAVMDTSVAMILASDGIRAPISYRLMQRRNRRRDGGVTTSSFRIEISLIEREVDSTKFPSEP